MVDIEPVVLNKKSKSNNLKRIQTDGRRTKADWTSSPDLKHSYKNIYTEIDYLKSTRDKMKHCGSHHRMILHTLPSSFKIVNNKLN